MLDPTLVHAWQTPKKICVISIRKLTCYKDSNGSKHPAKLFCLKCPQWLKINKKKLNLRNGSCVNRFSDLFKGSCSLPNALAGDGVWYLLSPRETWMDLIFVWKYCVWQLFLHFLSTTTSRHRIQLKLSRVTFIVSFSIILHYNVNQHYVNQNQSVTLSLSMAEVCQRSGPEGTLIFPIM